MLRSHCRISYQHTEIDMEIIKEDMAALMQCGVDGFVFGALTYDRDIDVKKCRQVIENAHGLPVTFHRAFDMTTPAFKFQNIDKIAECGFSRVLSSGFADNAEQGAQVLAEIGKYINEKRYNLILMPGCGVTTKNAAFILQTTGCKEFHASAKQKCIEKITTHESDTSTIKTDIENNSFVITDCAIVQELVAIGKTYL